MAPISVTIFANQTGTYFLEDDGVPGNNFSQIRFPDGTIVTFEHPTGDLFFNPSVAGVTLVVNLTDGLGAANFTVGSLTNAAQSPDAIVMQNVQTSGLVSLSSNGSITEGSDADAAADIIAGALILSAATGVGVPGNALETQTGALEAETTTGGINLANFGNVTIGGLTADVIGLQVATSGDLVFTNFGSILLSESAGFSQVSGGTSSGNVTLIANGFGSDILTNVNRDAISAPAGNILVQAGQDLLLGTSVGFDNDFVAAGSITINAGRDVVLDGDADLVSDTSGTGGNIVITAGRNVSLPTATSTSNITALGVAGSDVIITTGAGGTFLLNPNGLSTITSSSGDVIVNADRIAIGATSGISAAISVTLQPATPGRPIILGTGPDSSFAVELSDAELDRISTPNLIVGGNSAGPVTVISAISPANAPNLILRSGTDINVQSNITTTSSLRLSAFDNVFQLSASTITTGSFQVFVDSVDDDPGVGGIATLNGTITATSNVINGNLDADTLNGNAAANFLFGFAGNDTLRGFGGADTLDGGSGADTMRGGLGDDTFIVDNASDVVTELAGEGNDIVRTSVSYVLAAGQSIESLVLDNAAATTALDLTGNELSNTIVGNAGSNVLNGGGGADTLIGLGGSDTYIVDNAGDVVVEEAGGGANDSVFTSVSYVLAAGTQVETLATLDWASTAAINLTGNEFANYMIGNAGSNVLNGGGGADTLIGREGSDTYIVDNAGDVVIEEAGGGGNDSIFTSVSYVLAGGTQVETLATLDWASTAAIDLTGNEFANYMIGNAGSNVLNGGGGADILVGREGSDTYIVDNAGDFVSEEAGGGANDSIFTSVSYALAGGSQVETLATLDWGSMAAINLTGNEFANYMIGNAGTNVLDGKGGNDVLQGLGGADSFAFTTALGSSNIDLVFDFAAGTDKILLDDAVFTGLGLGALSASAFRTGASAQDADDRIIYDAATGALYFDADGNGAGAAVQFAVLQPGLSLTANDFSVI